MKVKTILGVAAGALVASIIGGVGSGITQQYLDAQGAAERTASLEQQALRTASLRRLLAESLDERNQLSPQDVMLFQAALAEARPCTETASCGLLWEWNESSDYYTIPQVAHVSRGPGDVYLIVAAETQYVYNHGDYTEPRLVVYHIGRGGVATRVAEDGTVYTAWLGYMPGDEPNWRRSATMDAEYGRQFRALALQAAIAEGQTF